MSSVSFYWVGFLRVRGQGGLSWMVLKNIDTRRGFLIIEKVRGQGVFSGMLATSFTTNFRWTGSQRVRGQDGVF